MCELIRPTRARHQGTCRIDEHYCLHQKGRSTSGTEGKIHENIVRCATAKERRAKQSAHYSGMQSY